MRWMIVSAALLCSATAQAADEYFVTVDEAKAQLGKARFVWADKEKDFEKEHIAGSGAAYAHDLSILSDVKACKGLPLCEPAAAKLIGQELGIDSDTDVIVYDGGAGANASGLWFLLKLFGHDKVKILDGGLATWKAHGGKVESGPAAKVAPKTFTPKVRWDMIATVDEVKKATGDQSHYLIVDARHNLDEYTGRTLQAAMAAPGKEATVARGGYIPTAVFSPWSKYAGNKGSKADKPTLKDEGDLKKQLKKLAKNGYAPDKTVISYCHVGLGRGTFQYIALKKAGHKDVKVYVGSWNEWGNDSALPLGAQP